jgi:hypothetical protein
MIERLEEHLVARGLLSQERADDALRSQALVGGAMDTLLLEMGALREQDLITALGELSGLQPIYLADYVPNPAMAAALPREDAERLNIAPLSVEDGMLHVAVAFPVPMRGLEVLVRKLGRSVRAVGVHRREGSLVARADLRDAAPRPRRLAARDARSDARGAPGDGDGGTGSAVGGGGTRAPGERSPRAGGTARSRGGSFPRGRPGELAPGGTRGRRRRRGARAPILAA